MRRTSMLYVWMDQAGTVFSFLSVFHLLASLSKSNHVLWIISFFSCLQHLILLWIIAWGVVYPILLVLNLFIIRKKEPFCCIAFRHGSYFFKTKTINICFCLCFLTAQLLIVFFFFSCSQHLLMCAHASCYILAAEH